MVWLKYAYSTIGLAGAAILKMVRKQGRKVFQQAFSSKSTQNLVKIHKKRETEREREEDKKTDIDEI